MLTNLYYYDNYKNKLLSNSKKTDSVKTAKQEQFLNLNLKNSEKASNDKSILLNKAYNAKVVSYISDVATSVNELKSSTSAVIKEIKYFNKSLKHRGEKESLNIVKDELDSFVSTFNLATEIFDENIKDSNYLKDYYNKIGSVFSEDEDVLNDVGIKIGADNKLTFDEEFFDSEITTEKFNSLKNLGDVFSKFNNNTNEILQVPLSKHMEFKNFNYYFNYKINTTYNDTFRLVESGTLIDIAV